MGDLSDLCMWCGRFTTLKAADGLADCDRPDCLERRDPDDDWDLDEEEKVG